ncbi:MAG: class I SAM-dependent methyltransferase, partial [Candidatus Eremiobacteraeota bacterium]|nr:class I SAM-dependent methyltransferase [Candidatus Eremiobacteraeota bacterium]
AQVVADLNVTFELPLPDGRMLAQGPLTFNFDGLATNHNADFMTDPRFKRATDVGWDTGHKFPYPLETWWRVHFLCWSAEHALRLGGDFIEFGVHTGHDSRSCCEYIEFEKHPDRTWYLMDTFEGIPSEQLLQEEVALGMAEQSKSFYFDCYELTKKNFEKFPNVKLVRGKVPETLAQVPSEKFAYCHIDMNNTYAEVMAGRWVWDRLIPGAMVFLDDYGYSRQYVNQKNAWDELGRELGFEVAALPTGQGLFVKT